MINQTKAILESVEVMSPIDHLILADHYEEEGFSELATIEREIAAYIQLGAYKPKISPLIKRIGDLAGYRGRKVTIQVADKVTIEGTAWDEGSVNRFYLFKTWKQALLNIGSRLWDHQELPLSIEGETQIVAKIEVAYGEVRGLTLFIRPEDAPTIFPKK